MNKLSAIQPGYTYPENIRRHTSRPEHAGASVPAIRFGMDIPWEGIGYSIAAISALYGGNYLVNHQRRKRNERIMHERKQREVEERMRRQNRQN